LAGFFFFPLLTVNKKNLFDYNSFVKQNYFLHIILILVCTSCGIQVQEIGAETPTGMIITSTLPPTQTAIPSSTPLPPPPSPTIAPVSGTATTRINIRSAPSTASETIGVIPADTVVQIVGKDPGESWWQILYPQGEEGKAWVVAQYILVAGKPEVPVIGGGGLNPADGNVAIVQQKINIRSGPGTSFNSIGTLNPQDVVALIGKDANGAWLQIEFALGPEGKGWINAAFAQAKGVDTLPIVSEGGQVIGTGTPENTPVPPTETVVPAPADNDSADNPLVSVMLDSTNTRTLIYGGDVSAPSGDTQDWIKFEASGSAVILTVECRGNSALSVDISGNHQPVRENIACGERIQLPTNSGVIYLVTIQANPTAGSLQYTQYTIHVEINP
jgi:uncharacterized protein YraI